MEYRGKLTDMIRAAAVFWPCATADVTDNNTVKPWSFVILGRHRKTDSRMYTTLYIFFCEEGILLPWHIFHNDFVQVFFLRPYNWRRKIATAKKVLNNFYWSTLRVWALKQVFPTLSDRLSISLSVKKFHFKSDVFSIKPVKIQSMFKSKELGIQNQEQDRTRSAKTGKTSPFTTHVRHAICSLPQWYPIRSKRILGRMCTSE